MDGERIEGTWRHAFIRNGGTYFLTDLLIYADGMVDCWGLETLEGFAGKLASGWVATDLPEETVTVLQQTAVAAYQALELRDYGRVDMRLQTDGRVHVIEVNPNPWLSSKAEFAMAARKSGRNYSQLIEEIVELAMARA